MQLTSSTLFTTQITGEQAANGWCAYYIFYAEKPDEVIFIWYSKIATAFGFAALLSNPNFIDKEFGFDFIGYYDSKIEAKRATKEWIRARGIPILNWTNRAGSLTMIKCNETGQLFLDQTEAAHLIGVNPAMLSQHLNRRPGYSSARGLTYSRVQIS